MPPALWARLQALCTATHPTAERGGLLPGLTETEVARVQEALGLTLPSDLAEAYRAFNGMGLHSGMRLLPEGFAWLPLMPDSRGADVLSKWRIVRSMVDAAHQDADRAQRLREDRLAAIEVSELTFPGFLDATRIPVGDDGAGEWVFAETQPLPGGAVGQVVLSDPGLPGSAQVIASSFIGLIERVVVAFERGEIRYDFADRARWVYCATGEDFPLAA